MKLDQKRKAALMTIGVALIFCAMIGQAKSPQVTQASVPAQAQPIQQEALPEQVSSYPVLVQEQTPPTPSQNVQEEPSLISDFIYSISQPIEPAVQNNKSDLEEETSPKFIVYQDNPNKNHYVLSGFMPDGRCVSVNSSWREDCQEGKTCLQMNYDTQCSKETEGWAGTYWLSPANNWGDKKGGYELTGAQKLIFWARGQEGGELIDTFKIGGITGQEHPYPDSDEASIGPIRLSKEWQEYSIDLNGKDLSYIVGGFAWFANAESNPQGMTFYLDNIYYQ